MNLQNALMILFVILVNITNGYILQSGLDNIIELLESIKKKIDINEEERRFAAKEEIPKDCPLR